MSFKNSHLSFSRLDRYETCPRSFALKYVEKKQPLENPIAPRLGKVVHRTNERLVAEHVEAERIAPLSAVRASHLFQDAWRAEGLSGASHFADGLSMVETFVRDQGVLDSRDVLAIERPFALHVGRFTIVGAIDRVDRVSDEEIEVIDYKTNRLLFTREDTVTSLQMSLYETAARRMWPWAKKVRLTFWMLRHGLKQRTERTPQQLESALSYAQMLGAETETATSFPPRLNSNCCYCDYRKDCDAYGRALAGKSDVVAEDLADLERVSREREQLAAIVKVAEARKRELEKVIKAQLEERESLEVAGKKYKMFSVCSKTYPLEETIEKLAAWTGQSRDDLLARIAIVDKEQLEKLVKEQPNKLLLQAELDAKADKSYSARLWATEARR